MKIFLVSMQIKYYEALFFKITIYQFKCINPFYGYKAAMLPYLTESHKIRALALA